MIVLSSIFSPKRSFLSFLFVILLLFPKVCSFVIFFKAPQHVNDRTAKRGAPPRHCHSLHAHTIANDSYIFDDDNNTHDDSYQRLQDPPDPLRNPNDNSFRQFRASVPLPLQYFLRDSGLLRLISDSLVLLGIPSLCNAYPTAWKDFQTVSGRTSDAIRFENLKYGQHRSQRMEVIRTNARQQSRNKWIVFVHGGAWGSGFPLLYRLVANSFVSKGFHVAIVGYRTYPDTFVDGQINDIGQAITFLQAKETKNENIDMTLVGHSSGAHICMLGILQSKIPQIQRFVGISGVYDIPHHYQFESKRGVERISPLAPVCGGNLSEWKRNSPSRWHSNASNSSSLPPTLLLHGEMDSTVPYTSSVGVFQSLKKAQLTANDNENTPIELKIFKGVEHAETVLHLMFGGETRETVLKWILKS